MVKNQKKITQAGAEEIALKQNSAHVTEADPEAQIQSYEIKKVDNVAGTEAFNPKENLRTLANGTWRYICNDINAVADEAFESDLAKNFGIKKNDMIFLVAQKQFRIVVV